MLPMRELKMKCKNWKENPYYGESENLVTLSPAIMWKTESIPPATMLWGSPSSHTRGYLEVLSWQPQLRSQQELFYSRHESEWESLLMIPDPSFQVTPKQSLPIDLWHHGAEIIHVLSKFWFMEFVSVIKCLSFYSTKLGVASYAAIVTGTEHINKSCNGIRRWYSRTKENKTSQWRSARK